MASLGRVAEIQVAAVTLGGGPQPAVGQAPAVAAWADGAVGERVRLSFLDGVGPVQAGVARHLEQGTWLEVEVDAVEVAAELHQDGGAQGQGVELVVGRVGVDVGGDASAGGVVLQADLVGGPALVGGDQGLEPGGEGSEGDVGVDAKRLVVERVAVVQRDAPRAVRPRELALEDAQQLLLVLGRDKVVLPKEAAGFDG